MKKVIAIEQFNEALRLLRDAWVTVDYFDHKGKLSVEIEEFLKNVNYPIVYKLESKL